MKSVIIAVARHCHFSDSIVKSTEDDPFQVLCGNNAKAAIHEPGRVKWIVIVALRNLSQVAARY